MEDSGNFTKRFKRKLANMGGEYNFTCKNEHRIYLSEKRSKHGCSVIDHVWLKDIPYPGGKSNSG